MCARENTFSGEQTIIYRPSNIDIHYLLVHLQSGNTWQLKCIVRTVFKAPATCFFLLMCKRWKQELLARCKPKDLKSFASFINFLKNTFYIIGTAHLDFMEARFSSLLSIYFYWHIFTTLALFIFDGLGFEELWEPLCKCVHYSTATGNKLLTLK